MGTRFYQSPHLDIERMAYDLESIFRAQDYQTQHFGDKDRIVVQLRAGGDFEAVIGLQAALTVTLQRTSSGVTAIVGQQKWIDKAAVGALGMLFLWPLAVTAGVGILRQAHLEEEILRALDTVALQQQPDVKMGPVPSHLQDAAQQQSPSSPSSDIPPSPQASPVPPAGQLQCLYCQEMNDADDFYCSHCGKPLALRKKLCPQCKAQVKVDATFCPKCGVRFT